MATQDMLDKLSKQMSKQFNASQKIERAREKRKDYLPRDKDCQPQYRVMPKTVRQELQQVYNQLKSEVVFDDIPLEQCVNFYPQFSGWNYSLRTLRWISENCCQFDWLDQKVSLEQIRKMGWTDNMIEVRQKEYLLQLA
jgi:hypothetical protein